MQKLVGKWYHRPNLGLELLLRLVGVGVVGLALVVGIVQFHSVFRGESEEFYQATVESYLRRVALGFKTLDIDPNTTDSVEQERVRPLFTTPIFDNTGYLFLVKPSGELKFHFYRSSTRLPEALLEEMANSPERTGVVDWQPEGDGGRRKIYYSYSVDSECYFAVEADFDHLVGRFDSLYRLGWLVLAVLLLVVWWLVGFVSRRLVVFLEDLLKRTEQLARGEKAKSIQARGSWEVGKIGAAFNRLLLGLQRVTQFASELQRGNWNAEYTPLGDGDTLGAALLALRDSMKRNETEAAARKKEDEQRNWSNRGLAEFARLLREHSDNIDELTDTILQHLVQYLGAAQGGMYVLREHEDGRPFLRLESAFAYNRKKFMEEQVELGEGLVGTCAVEQEAIHLDALPESYCTITSGIGHIAPHELLLVPLKADEGLLGVVELASLKSFSPHVVEFMQTLSVSIAQTMQLVINAQKTNALLARQTEQSEMMRAQEEELRQNIEELHATQEQIQARRAMDATFGDALSQAFLYLELSVEGVILRSNARFEAFRNRLGYSSDSSFDLFSQVRYLPQLGVQSEEIGLSWARVVSGEELQCTLEWSGVEGAKLFTQSTFVLVEEGEQHQRTVLLMGQDISGVVRSGMQGGESKPDRR